MRHLLLSLIGFQPHAAILGSESATGGPASMLLLDEYFAKGDNRFEYQLRQATDPKQLAALAERFERDSRPWALAQMHTFLREPLIRVAHYPLYKRLFKLAEKRGDHEAVGACMAAFDRSIRRTVQTEYRWNRETRQSVVTEHLATARLQPFSPEMPRSRLYGKPKMRTRHYLQRRAWRYFRRLAHGKPTEYVPALARALRCYRDADLEKGPWVLGQWGLLHACFHHSDVITFTSSCVELCDGKGLGDLRPAPYAPELWQAPAAALELLGVATEARSRLVQVWAIELIRKHHMEGLGEHAPAFLKALLDSELSEMVTLGIELLERLPNLDRQPMEFWLDLLSVGDPAAQEAVCKAFRRHVATDRVSVEQAVELARRSSVPVATLGLELLKDRRFPTAAAREPLLLLAEARCEAVGEAIGGWTLGVLAAPDIYDTDVVCRFFDSRNPGIRRAAWGWMTLMSPGYLDAVLWARITESPYPDVRERLIAELDARTQDSRPAGDLLAPLWLTVLAGIGRGGAAKPKALRQLVQAVQHSPDLAPRLLPVIGLAVRSVRGPEFRAGLAAVATLALARPDLAPLIAVHLPELTLAVPADTAGGSAR